MRYGVLGGGVLGLTAALRLAQTGDEVTVFERAAVPGGLASSFEVAPDIWLERFYHHLFASDHRAIELIEELGLEDRLVWHRPVTTVFVDGRVLPLDSPKSVLQFDPLSPVSRLHMAAGLGVLRLMPSPWLLGNASTGRILPRLMGGATYRTVWQPLLLGKFGDAADHISMAWMWARIHSRTSRLGYLRGGFHHLYAALAEAVSDAGGTIVYGADVRSVRRLGSCLTVDAAGTGALEFDRVISTLPAAITARLADLSASYTEQHPPPASLGAHCLVVELDRQLSDVYWIGINDPSMPFLAVVEHTNMLSPEQYGGRHLVYFGNYRPMTDPIFTADADSLIQQWQGAIQRINPQFTTEWVRRAWTFAAPNAQPVVRPGYAKTIPGFRTPMDGLFLATMFQVYPYDRGQNFSIALAERLVRELRSEA
jgi:protoporphyrinogen oxidase